MKYGGKTSIPMPAHAYRARISARGKGPYRWYSIPFLYKAQQKDNPPGLHLTAIIYVAASCLFSMQYHFKPRNAKIFCFVCEVGCGELEHSSRL